MSKKKSDWGTLLPRINAENSITFGIYIGTKDFYRMKHRANAVVTKQIIQSGNYLITCI
jgi:hypothetical protein